ncbi:hypothetical protein CEXT_473611 [Caerostris extrusa]|uniref:Uncharacterized protein n=1 Tax=Caerostris extrusa TaxID=172846 RepID=A0AAV4TMU2_CAEEX|nr:hypothetical protein CEXT_473611 [Caerostris extrusa]
MDIFSCRCFRNESTGIKSSQTALARLHSGHIKSLTFVAYLFLFLCSLLFECADASIEQLGIKEGEAVMKMLSNMVSWTWSRCLEQGDMKPQQPT